MPQPTPVPRDINANTEVVSLNLISLGLPQTPAVSVTPAHPESTNNNKTGIVDPLTVLQEVMSNMISNGYSSDDWPEDDKGYGSDGWSESEIGYISSPPRKPLTPLPVTSDNFYYFNKNFAMLSSDGRESRELMEVTDDSDRKSEDNRTVMKL